MYPGCGGTTSMARFPLAVPDAEPKKKLGEVSPGFIAPPGLEPKATFWARTRTLLIQRGH
jgi:hypothetical protein